MSQPVARLTLTIDVPGWHVAELKRMVEQIEFDPFRDTEIDVKDIMTALFSGDLPEAHIIVYEQMEDVSE